MEGIGRVSTRDLPHGSTPVPDKQPSAAERERLQRAARDFEALLVGTMLRTMRQTTQSMAGSGTGGTADAGIMSEVMDEHFAVALARGGGIGLAKLLGGQIEAQQQRRNQVAPPDTARGSLPLEEKP